MPIVITGGPSVETIGLELDPDGSSVNLNDGSLYRLTAIDLPEPPLKSIYASNFDTEGSLPAAEHGYENREVTLTLMVFAADPVSLRALISTLNEKEQKINRESRGTQPGGVLRVTLPDDVDIDFDLLQASATGPLRHEFFTHSRTEITLTFIAKPFWRGTEVDLGTFSETTLPFLIAVLPEIAGDALAIARAVFTDLSGNNQALVKWGAQSRFYDAATTAALFYQAEALTPLGGAATAVGAAGASGSGSNVVRQGTLTPGWQAMLSTEHPTNGHMTHVGSFDVLARIYTPTTNTGAVSAALEWGQGDLRRRTTNDAAEFEAGHYREGQFIVVRLGQVHIAEGSEQWEGRVIAKSTVAGDDLDVDCFALFPITERSGELSALAQIGTPTAFSARDEFDQTSGDLTGKTLPAGGTWVGAGDTDDFSVNTTDHTARRTAVSDTGMGRFAIAGTTAFTDLVVQADFKTSSAAALTDTAEYSVVGRYTDDTHFIGAGFFVNTDQWFLRAILRDGAVFDDILVNSGEVTAATAYKTLRLYVGAAGNWKFWCVDQGSPFADPVLEGFHSSLAPGAGLASGKATIRDAHFTANARTRDWDNFAAWAPIPDAAIYANQSLELTHEGATREDSTGTFPSDVSSVRGNYLRLAPAGAEGRQNRLLVKGFRNDPDTLGDPGIDDLQVQVFATPRGVSIPSS